MTRGIEKLTQRRVNAAIAARGKCFLSDGGNLYLQIDGDAASWIYQYVDGYGKVRNMGLGSAREVSLDDAREERRKCARQRKEDIDPIEARERAAEQRRLDAGRDRTFAECAEA